MVLRALILGGIVTGLWLALRRAGLGFRERTITWLGVAAPLLAWYLAVLEFASSGGFESRFTTPRGVVVPPIPFAILLPPLIWLPALLRSRRMAAALDAVSPAWLIAFQVYRLRGSVFLARWAAGALPGAFALPAGIGDVLVGALAIPVALLLHSGARGGRGAAYAWNVLGILDLLVAITLGALTTTGRLAVEVPNTAPTTYPLVMIPAFAVPLSLILHGLSLWQLRRAAHRCAPVAHEDVELSGSSPRTTLASGARLIHTFAPEREDRMGTMISFPRTTKGTAQGYLAEAKEAKAPGVVVIQEWWGLQGQIKSVCERFAEAGFTALAPDLYDGKVVPYHDEKAASAAMSSLDFVAATSESVRGAVRHLKARGGKVGLIGFCMGGAVAVIGAARIAELDAAVSFYGLPPPQVASGKDVRVPLQGHFANQDDWVTPDKVDAFEKELKASGKPHEFFRYDAHHAFMNSDRKEVHDPKAAKLAWDRALAWFRKYLG